MASTLGIRLQYGPRNFAAVNFSCLPFTSAQQFSARNNGFKPSSRVLISAGLPFLFQIMNMAGNFASKSFIASARQKGAVEKVLENVEWPEQVPSTEEDFQLFEKSFWSPDTVFYENPRFVTHIDYSTTFPPNDTPGVAVLRSWVSRYPKGYKLSGILEMGSNEEELKKNPASSISKILPVVSVDYLTKPLDVFKEVPRILKTGGLAIMSFSNRCFLTKAISICTSTGDADHAMIVGAYFHYAGGFVPPKAVDISPNPGRTDPIYIVYSRKLATA